VELNADAAEPYAVWAGAEAAADAPFAVKRQGYLWATQGRIGGWVIQADALYRDGLWLDAAGEIRGNFTAGQAGWRITAGGDAEFNNLTARGELRATTFVQEELSAVGGGLLVRPAGTLAAPVTTL
jgi:hypothetical protein